jgi:hypothetical protein
VSDPVHAEESVTSRVYEKVRQMQVGDHFTSPDIQTALGLLTHNAVSAAMTRVEREALGKTLRWGLYSVNPELPPVQQTLNWKWV